MSSKPELVDDMWRLIRPFIPQDQRDDIAREMCCTFEDHNVESYESDIAHDLICPEGVLRMDTRVQTLKPLHNDRYNKESIKERKWGTMGAVLQYHDSHGLCYTVKHDDGSTACYDPDEIEIIPEDQS